MRSWLSQHRSALRLALRRLAATPLTTILSVLAIGIALALPTGGALLLLSGQQLLRTAAPTPQLSVYLPLAADLATVQAVERRLTAHPGVGKLEFIDREATLMRFKTSEGLREVIEALPRNPFPHAFVIYPTDGDPRAIDTLAQNLRQWREFEHVQLDSEWVRRLDALLRLGRLSVMTLAVLFAVGLLGITFNITRLQVMAQRDEIQISELLGATPAFIRRPFLYFGCLLGLFGGTLAWFIVAVAIRVLAPPLGELAAAYGVSLPLAGPSVAQAAALIGLSAALGAAGTALAVRR